MCSICEGYSSAGCPVCSPEPAECPDCKGDGTLYFHYIEETNSSVQVPYNVYARLSPENRSKETCTTCNGDGILKN